MKRPLQLDWKKPDYGAMIALRHRNLTMLSEMDAQELAELKNWYRFDPQGPAEFINDWGWTYDPRNADINLPTLIPFILFKRQREWIDWVLERWAGREPGICEKSRDMGVSWLAMALSCTLCLFRDGIAIGVGSRKGEYVDKIGTIKPLLPKGRMFMKQLPKVFKGDWNEWRDAPFMRITFPMTGSFIGGEGGDDIGRGDRTSIYFVDEAAHLERPELVEASLSQTTNCRIDMSSVKGMNNPFAQKRWGGKVKYFIFDWRDDPRKDDAWYAKQCEDLDPVVVAQEIDRDYQASVTGVVIPAAWVRAAIDVKKKLGIAPSGKFGAALDVADEGEDKNAFGIFQGTTILSVREWSGKGGDIYETTEEAFRICEQEGLDGFKYDADGLGAGVRGDARTLNAARMARGARPLAVVGFRGSEAVHDPDGIVGGTIGLGDGDGRTDRGRTNKDYFGNRKAQGWWALRKRFERTYNWVVKGKPCAPDDIIEISSACPNYMNLVAEISQPTYRQNEAGKILINKKPDKTKSPNLADAVMIHYAPSETPPVTITSNMLAQIAAAGRSR